MTQRQPVRTRAQNSPGVTNWLLDPRVQGNLRAFTHGAGDSLPFGVADRVSATIKAIRERGGRDFSASYNRHMAAERAQDRDEARRYGVARTVGQIAGTGAQIVALGGLEGMVASGSRIPQITGIIARETKALGAVGAGGGVAGQAASDIAHRRMSSPGDYAGAAIGGSAQALASTRGLGSSAGAIGGATTSLAQDLANGRIPSVERSLAAASQGALLGAGAGAVGRTVSNRLPNHLKGTLGEAMSVPRTWARGERVLPIKNQKQPLSRSFTVPDHWTSSGARVESKFGKGIGSLKGAQRRAFQMKPREWEYRVDSWLPQDVGTALAFLPSQQGYLHKDERWPPAADRD